jgi:hypothetical protein
MKKSVFCFAGLILLIFLIGCSNNDKPDFFGNYTFEKVSYLSPLSSSTVDYVNEQMAGTKYTVKADLFKVESNNIYSTLEINSPKYVREKVPVNTSKLSDIHSFISKDVQRQYTIDGTHKRLYISSDSIWIASYVDNTADGSEIIMDIYKLKRTSE